MTSRAVDIEINDTPYMLAQPPYGIRLGFRPKEPGSAGAVGTIEIPSFHLGPGEYIARTPGRYFRSYGCEPGVPMQLGRVGSYSNFGVGTMWTQVQRPIYMGALLVVTKADSASTDRIIAVGPEKAVVFDAGTDGSNQLEKSSSACLTGSLAKHKGIVWIGQESWMGPGWWPERYDIKNHTFIPIPESNPDPAFMCSRVLSSRSLFWWVENVVGNPPRAPKIRAHPDPDILEESVLTGVSGPFDLSPGNYCTGMMRFGYWVRTAMADGNLHGVDEEGIIAPMLPELPAAASYHTGTQIVAFLDKVAISAPGRIYALDLASLEISDISPPVLQGDVDWNVVGATPALFSDGVELWAAVAHRENGEGATVLWRLMQYPDGQVAWTPIFWFKTAAQQVIPKALTIYDDGVGTRHAYILTHLGSAITLSTIFHIELPPPGNTPPRTSNYETTTLLETSRYRSEAMVSGKFLQVRGYQRETPNPAQQLHFEVDGSGTFSSLGTVTSPGPFSLAFPATAASIGRLIALRLSGDPGRLYGPLYVDYLQLPSSDDDLTVDILAGTNPLTRKGTILRKSGLSIVEELRALKGDVTTLKFLHSRNAAGEEIEWTVLVVDVQGPEAIKPGGTDPAEERVSLLIRRLA